jgi:hypothetical protein
LTAITCCIGQEQLKKKEQKINYFVQWDCIICGYFHGLKKMVAEKNYSLQQPIGASD